MVFITLLRILWEMLENCQGSVLGVHHSAGWEGQVPRQLWPESWLQQEGRRRRNWGEHDHSSSRLGPEAGPRRPLLPVGEARLKLSGLCHPRAMQMVSELPQSVRSPKN